MKKHFVKLVIIFLIIFISSATTADAACGDLVYDVLKLSINEGGIRVEGWAFLHKTLNGYKRNNNKATSESTNQKIQINICDKYGVCYFDDNEGIIDGKGFDFDRIMGYTLADGTREMKYTYQNIGFNVKFETSKLIEKFGKNGEKDQDLHFTIAVTNDDYNARASSCKGTPNFNNLTETQRIVRNGKHWVKENLKVLNSAIRGETNNDKIKIKASGTDQLLYTGWHTGTSLKKGNANVYAYIGWGQIYLFKGTQDLPLNSYGDVNYKATNPGQYYISARTTKNCYYSTGEGCSYYTCANYENKTYNDNYLNIYEYEDGYSFSRNGLFEQAISNVTNNNAFSDVCTDDWVNVYKNTSYAKIYGDTTITIKVKNDKKCEVSEPAGNKIMSCNNWKDLSSTCDELTVRNGSSSATVKVEQKGYITNIFKSNLVNEDKKYDANSYNGGWFKYGITYYNEVSWSIVNLYGNVDEIESAIKSRLKLLNNFQDNLNLTITGLEEITGNKLIKKCSESGSFTNGNKLITVCTFFLPSSVLENFNGTVNYLEDENKANINNKYYIPLDAKNYEVSVKLENLSRLSETQAKKDSKDKNKVWFGTWNIDTNCLLKVTNRIYEPSGGGEENGKVKYKFIYRPINLSNPFPNRFPGVNWYTWYITEGNKDRKTLEDSYTKLEYYTELDNRTISTIKEYNKINDYFGEVDSNFFKTYIKEGGQG